MPKVAVERRVVAVFVVQRAEFAQVVADSFGRDGRVFPALIVRRLAGNLDGHTERGFANAPQRTLLAEVDDEAASDRTVRQQVGFAAACCRNRWFEFAYRAELAHQPTSGLAVAARQQPFVFGAEMLDVHEAKQPVVDALERDRFVRVDAGDGIAGPGDVLEREHENASTVGILDQVDFGREDDDARALRADQRARDVEAVFR